VSSPPSKPDKPLTPSQAWQPLTPRGVAAFAHATFTRLIVVQLIFAVMVAVAVIWFIRVAWFPVVTEAMRRLPETGAIRGGELDFGGTSPQRLAENARLAIGVDVNSVGIEGQAADLEIIFGKNHLTICGALGCWKRAYGQNYIIGFNRSETEAAWGAWQWWIIGFVAIGTVVVLMTVWWAVAFIYFLPARLFAFFADRKMTLAGAWRLSAAALLPGALLVAAAILLHGLGTIGLFQFVLIHALHIVAGLVFVITSPFFLPVVVVHPGKNPFGPPPSSESVPKKSRSTASPFSRRRRD
jgi:hypothetical protein